VKISLCIGLYLPKIYLTWLFLFLFAVTYNSDIVYDTRRDADLNEAYMLEHHYHQLIYQIEKQ